MSASRHYEPGAPFDAVVVLGSQGAFEAFLDVLGCLPETFPAAIVFDLHRGTDQRFTEEILRRRGVLRVRSASAGALFEPGTVHVVPPDADLLVTGDGAFALAEGDGEGQWHHRADALLSSAAQAFGPRLIGVVLSGRLDAGASGVRDVKRLGGRVLVQDPETARAGSMPRAALATGCVDFALPPRSLGQALAALCASPGAAELFRVRLNAGVRG